MRWRLRYSVLVAGLIFLALFAMRFAAGDGRYGMTDFSHDLIEVQSNSEGFQLSRKNYASGKRQLTGAESAAAIAPGDPGNERYEKIGTLAQVSREFEADRKRLSDLIADNKAVLQQERAVGLEGRRALQLGIGVPPEKFDAFIEAVRRVGRNTSIEVVKNDKTNEYLQLKAKRQTLEKARAALEDLRAGGGSTEERVVVQNRLTEIEQQIQDLGVSLGEFDTQNELCTVKVSLREAQAVRPMSWKRRAFNAFQGALGDYAMLGLGFAGIMAAFWFAAAGFTLARRLIATG